MRLIYCIPRLSERGGTERVLTGQVNYLAEHTDWEITILTTELVPEGEALSAYPLDERIRVEELKIDFNADFSRCLPIKWWNHERRMFQYKRALREIISRLQPDVLISMGGKEIAFLSSLPCHSLAQIHFTMQQRRLLIETFHKGRFWSLLGKIRVAQLVHDVRTLRRLVVLTQADKEEWERHGCTNVICIPNICTQPTPSASVERQKIVLAVGRLHPEKGFDLLLEAWSRVIRHSLDTRLRIVGEGSERNALQTKITSLSLSDSVELAGRVEDMPYEYEHSTLLAVSSRHEGLPMSIIEAEWFGLPCVSFDCPNGPSELLAENRGVLVPNGDVEALAKAIEDLLNDDNQRAIFAQRGQTYAHRRFAPEAVMKQWIEVIQEVVG